MPCIECCNGNHSACGGCCDCECNTDTDVDDVGLLKEKKQQHERAYHAMWLGEESR